MRTGAPFAKAPSTLTGAGSDAKVDAAGNHRLQGLTATIGVEDIEVEPVLLENARALADVGQAAVPVVGGADGELQHVVGMAGGGKNAGARRDQKKKGSQARHKCP